MKVLLYLDYIPEIKNKNAWDNYIAFIENYPDIDKQKFKTEAHHIIPRAYLRTEEEKEDRRNIVTLYSKDHFQAHLLLYQAFQDAIMTHAIWKMINSKGQNGEIDWISPEEFQNLREKAQMFAAVWTKNSLWIKKNGKNKRIPAEQLDLFLNEGWELGRNRSPEETIRKQIQSRKEYWRTHPEEREQYKQRVSGEGNAWFGKHHSEETLAILRKKNGIQTPGRIAARAKRAEKQRGKIAVNNGIVFKRIHPDDLPTFQKEGWQIGALRNTVNAGTITINNGQHEKRVKKEDLNSYILDGWKKGRCPRTEEHKKRIGEALKGKPSTAKGKKYSEEHKKKLSEIKKLQGMQYKEARKQGYEGSWNTFCHELKEKNKNER